MNPARISTDDVRMAIMDRSPEDNFLLDAVEVDEDTVAEGIRNAVDVYNETLPLVDCHTVDTFPYRASAILAAAAYCLRAKAVNHVRNKATTRAEGGTTLDDKGGRAEAYLSMASSMMNEARAQFKRIKEAINADSCYRSFV